MEYLYDLQLMPAGKGQLPSKSGKPIEKYGGYNKVKVAYFFVAEHTEKKARVRSIQPVYIYKKALYEKDPIAYCTEILGLCDPKIIYPRLLIHATVEIDGKRLGICGKSENYLLCRHEYQLAVSPADERYIKEISKYNGPVYLRLARVKTRKIYNENQKFEIGKAIQIGEGTDATVFATGICVSEALKAMDILKEKNINIRVIDMFSLKPIDRDIIIKSAKETKNLISVEDHSVIGGLGSIIADVLSEEYPSKLVKMGVKDRFRS